VTVVADVTFALNAQRVDRSGDDAGRIALNADARAGEAGR
jgi:hypothetical protein